MTKQELINNLNDTERITNMEADKLLDWYLELIYDYCETIRDDSLKELIQPYWCPGDICDYVEARLKDPFLSAEESLQEVADLLRYKDFETHWSCFDTDEEINFIDITKDELERLRQRILDFLANEDNNDKEG